MGNPEKVRAQKAGYNALFMKDPASWSDPNHLTWLCVVSDVAPLLSENANSYLVKLRACSVRVKTTSEN